MHFTRSFGLIGTRNPVVNLVTDVAHEWRDLQFRIPARSYSLTRLGLLRQINRLEAGCHSYLTFLIPDSRIRNNRGVSWN